jgi:hypothetical protein
MTTAVQEYQPVRVEAALAADRLGTLSVLGYVLSGVASRLLPASSAVLLLAGLARAGWLYAFRRDSYERIGGR